MSSATCSPSRSALTTVRAIPACSGTSLLSSSAPPAAALPPSWAGPCEPAPAVSRPSFRRYLLPVTRATMGRMSSSSDLLSTSADLACTESLYSYVTTEMSTLSITSAHEKTKTTYTTTSIQPVALGLRKSIQSTTMMRAKKVVRIAADSDVKRSESSPSSRWKEMPKPAKTMAKVMKKRPMSTPPELKTRRNLRAHSKRPM
mmetsp:Transcript_3680/g.11605  ORF Transcript_3680/g.11605 Transcript_3680/m.11605 type:complete len:202 (-) Transcript_3680:1461-2066(-)